jgi:hypothetical protein
VGILEGWEVGHSVGCALGCSDGKPLGRLDGSETGCLEGILQNLSIFCLFQSTSTPYLDGRRDGLIVGC